jgi:serine/threonine protein kinase
MEPETQRDPTAGLLAPGQVLADKYRILRLIGRGGMAEVYAAQHEILNQTVAVKVLVPAIAMIPGAAARFLNEARSAARIRSEHVAAVMDVGMREDGSAYIVLEYLEGEELQRVVDKRGPLPPSEAVDYVLQALEALAHAHAIGIVHRDLKPSNIFLARAAGGRTIVKVFDFGISKAPRSPEDADESNTASQMILGTPGYMAPEQARNAREVDARADIWALGVVLYRLLTGVAPFGGPSPADVLAAILVQPHRPMRERRPDLSAELDSIVSRCLAKEREARFANVAELALALAPHATFAARGNVDRVSRALGISDAASTVADPHAGLRLPEIPSAPALTPKPEVATNAAWMESSVAKRARSSTRRRLVTAGVGVALAAAAAAIAWQRGPHPGVHPVAGSEHPPEGTPPAPVVDVPAAAVVVTAEAPSAPLAARGPSDALDAAPPFPPFAAAPPATRSSAAPVPQRADAKPATAGPRPRPITRPAPSAPGYDVLDQRN